MRTIIGALTLILLCSNAISYSQNSSKQVELRLGSAVLKADLADTDQTRIEGLLGWSTIDDAKGMLLDFLVPGEYAIHMQGMKFPIDAIWIDSNMRIDLIYENIQPNSGQVYPSMFPVRFCLEVNSGFCNRHKVKIGQIVSFGK
jgi:uncharacterized protein